MVFKVMALQRLEPIEPRRQSRVGSRSRRAKKTVRVTRKTKVTARRASRRVGTRKASTTRRARRRVGTTRIRFATRKTKVFKPISASQWQVEHQQFGIGPLKKGELSEFGYSSSKPEMERDKSLDKAVKRYGSTSVFRKLNALSVYNKNRDPVRSNLFLKDRNYVKKTYMSQ